MDGAETIIQGDNSPGQKNKRHMSLSLVDAGFKSLDVCVSFRIPTEVSRLLSAMGRDFMGGERGRSCIESKKGSNRTGRVKLEWGEGGVEERV